MGRLSMEIYASETQPHQHSLTSRSLTPTGRNGSRATSLRSRPASITSKTSKRTGSYSVRRLNTAPPSVVNDEHEAPQRRFKSARLIGEYVILGSL
jgi:hypothetical protein